MDIAEVAKRSGLPASALRYYEQKGLIASTGREGLRRTFAPSVLDQLSLIALGQAAGFSLDEIRGMFAPDGRFEVRITNELEEALYLPGFDQDRFLQGASEMLDGVKVFWDGLWHDHLAHTGVAA